MIQCAAPVWSVFKSLLLLPLIITSFCTIPTETIVRHYYVNSGALWQVYHCKNGLADGVVKEYYENGALDSQYYISSGKKEGPLKSYFQKGTLREIINYKDNRKEWIRQYYESGIIKEEVGYKNGDIVTHTFFDEKGKLIVNPHAQMPGMYPADKPAVKHAL